MLILPLWNFHPLLVPHPPQQNVDNLPCFLKPFPKTICSCWNKALLSSSGPDSIEKTLNQPAPSCLTAVVINISFCKKKKSIYIAHIVPFGKFHRIGSAPPDTFPNVKYDAYTTNPPALVCTCLRCMVHGPAIRHVPWTMYNTWLLIKLCDKKRNACLLE